MHIVHVFIHVKPDKLQEFRAATQANAASSLQEPGVARFDFLQQADDPDALSAGGGISDAGGCGQT